MSASPETGPSPSTPGPVEKRTKKRWFAYFGANSLAISILLHVLFGVGATYLIVEHFQKKHVNFHATEPPSQHTEVEHKVELVKRNNVESAPPDLKRIVTTDVSSITLPEPPDVPTTDEATPSAMAGVDGVMGSGLGLGEGGGGGGGGGSPLYGAPDGNGLEGYLYDLKQTPDKKSTDIAETSNEVRGPETAVDGSWLNSAPTKANLRALRTFVKTWNMSMLDDNYYKAPQPLYLSQIAIPFSPSPEATKAFHVDGTVRARRWIVVYEGKISPHESGKYRFIGFADDFMVVRINGNNVLDASWPGLEDLDSSVDVHENVGKGPEGKPLRCGSWVDMSANDTVDMQVLIGEGPGGNSCFLLMVQKEGDGSPQGDYPVFQVQDSPIPDIGTHFTFSKKTLLFNLSK